MDDGTCCEQHRRPFREEDTEHLFAELLRRYRNPIVNLAYQLLRDRDEAEDVAQETFVQAFLHLKRFRGQSSLFTWLYRIAVNACRMRFRKARPLPISYVCQPIERGLERAGVDAETTSGRGAKPAARTAT
ncbi:MAG: sigma-70 family RNA polymerase sigma factor [Armatimonadota bacterium]|nr:sigma-70 family RNA polymerase sigma factor [Armatimonadota bacterium]